MKMEYPLITLGSPYGIGYEIFLTSFRKTILFNDHVPFCIGSSSILDFYKNLLEININYRSIKQTDAIDITGLNGEKFILIDIDDDEPEISRLQDINERMDGDIAYRSIDIAADLVMKGTFKSIVTMPVSKKNINRFDPDFKGHTEFFQKKWNEEKVFMTFVSDKLNVMLLSTHLPLKEISSYITPDMVKHGILASIELSKKLGLTKKICFLGINPHAGENGLLGDEEIWMKKLISEIDKDGMVVGPLPADTAFTEFNRAKYGLYISCYHDQGLIPFKMLAFEDGVNLSYGMKHVRTSVDHGTAVDLIGKNMANPESFINAYKLAIRLSR
jgi:4-hydroxythreonine-4-phosphate dehydrogenase